MKSSVSHGRARSTARLQVLAVIAGLSVPIFAGCPGALEGTGWVKPGSGGATATGSGGATGTGGSGAGTGGAGACDAETMFLKNPSVTAGCGAVGCHAAASPFGDLITDPWGAMFGQNAKLGPCAGMPLINSSKPASGVLFKRLSGKECGESMPFVQPISQPAIDCITSWANSKIP